MTHRTIATTAAVAAALAIALSGCSGGEPDAAQGAAAPSTSATAGATTTTEHNAADTAFAQGMVPHHRSALEMAELASTRAEAPEVRALAARVTAAQGPEIERMTSWLRAWGEEVPEEGASGGMEGMAGMDVLGMMSQEQMGELAGTRGATFDEMWLTGMVDHHEGAVEMARAEVAEGSDPDAVALARVIVDDQSAEIDQMRALLAAG